MAWAQANATDWIDMLRLLKAFASGTINAHTAGGEWIDGTNALVGSEVDACTITSGSASIAATNTFVAGEAVVFVGSMGTITGLVAGTTYFVSATGLSGSAFQVSATVGGAVITPAGGGTATPSVVGQYWYSPGVGSGESAIPGSGDATDGLLYLIGQGAGQDNITIGLSTYRNAGNSVYGIEIKGFTGFSSALTFTTMPGASPSCFSAYTNVTMPVWFYVNGRRIIMVAQIGSYFVCVYLGYVLQYSTRNQYPYPLLISGSVLDKTYNTIQNNFGTSCFPDPCQGGAQLRWVDGTWNVVQHYFGSGATRSAQKVNANYVLWPLRDTSVSDNAEQNTNYNEDDLFTFFSSTNHQISNSEISAYALIPVSLMNGLIPALIGQAEGVYVVPGLGLTATDTITDPAGQIYDVFKNTYRTEAADWFAIRRL